jgi:hypothetical protein
MRLHSFNKSQIAFFTYLAKRSNPSTLALPAVSRLGGGIRRKTGKLFSSV